jgi:hypothetical protein
MLVYFFLVFWSILDMFVKHQKWAGLTLSSWNLDMFVCN